MAERSDRRRARVPDRAVTTGGRYPAGAGRFHLAAYRFERPDARHDLDAAVQKDEALRRAEQDNVERPLLAGADRMEQATRLLAEREPLYASADLTIDVDGRMADAVVDDIVEWLKTNI